MANRKRNRKNILPAGRPQALSEKKWLFILDWLNAHGLDPKDVTLEDLLQIPGIGPRTVEKLEEIESDDPCQQRDDVQRGIEKIKRRQREENLVAGPTLH